MLGESPHLLHPDFALAPHNRILQSLEFRCFSLLIYGIIISSIWNVILNFMKAITNKIQNLFLWNKKHKCLNTTGPGYDSNVPNYLTINFSLQRLKIFVSKFNMSMHVFQGQKA